jgi:hypothetical protein
MAGITFTDYGQASSRAWMGDFSNRDHIVPGGGQLAAAGWSGLTDNVVPAGTLVGRTRAEQLAGAEFGPAADTDDEVYITSEDVDLDFGRGVNLVRHGSQIKHDLLPSYAAASAAVKTKVEAAYELVESAMAA